MKSSCYVSNKRRKLSSEACLLMLILSGGASKVFPPAGSSKVFPPAGSVQWGGFQAWLQGREVPGTVLGAPGGAGGGIKGEIEMENGTFGGEMGDTAERGGGWLQQEGQPIRYVQAHVKVVQT